MSNSPIKQYQGADVVSQKIKITRTGDGLSEAMTVEPEEFHIGDKRYVVLEVEVDKIGYERVKDTDVLIEVPTLRAKRATFVEETAVAKMLDEQSAAIAAAKQEADVDPDEI